MFFFNETKTIYNHIEDDMSREIYALRLLYSLTGDNKYMHDIVKLTPEGRELSDALCRKGKYVLFGAGIWGKNILRLYPDLNWICVMDNNPTSDSICINGKNIKVICPGDNDYDDENLIVISSRLYHNEIKMQLLGLGYKERQLIDAGGLVELMSYSQYFDLPQLEFDNEEVFVDAGAFDGMTSVCFHKRVNGKYKNIYAFEPDEKNVNKCKSVSISHGLHDFKLVSCGLWSEKTELLFDSKGNGGSKIEASGTETIRVNTLDSLLDGNDVSMIKMDLEGAELEALIGAEYTIKRCRPKLAISLYHKPEDVWEIPSKILEFNSDYRFYLRHYSIAASETVLYAL